MIALVRPALLLGLGALAACAGCAGNYFRTYQKAHPEWLFAFPATGADLEQTVASLYAPPPLGTQLSIRRLEILRVDTDPWQPIAFDELRSGRFESGDDVIYAVVANFTCQSRVDLQSYYGEKVGWYLLPNNRLRAFDHYEFVEACTVSNLFLPAENEHAALERALIAHLERHYPPSTVHVHELFQKGILYARVDRVEEAKLMLVAGSRAFDSSSDDKPTEFEGPGFHLELVRADEVRDLRSLLVREIAAAEARASAPK